MEDKLFMLTWYGADGKRVGLEIDQDPEKIEGRAKILPAGYTAKVWECTEIELK